MGCVGGDTFGGGNNFGRATIGVRNRTHGDKGDRGIINTLDFSSLKGGD